MKISATSTGFQYNLTKIRMRLTFLGYPVCWRGVTAGCEQVSDSKLQWKTL